MELNKTSESLYSCKTDRHTPLQDVTPEPNDNRDVKVFSLEGRQSSNKQERQQDKVADKQTRQDSRGSDEKNVSDKTNNASQEEEKTETEVVICENPTAGMALVDIAAPMMSEAVVETPTVAVASVDLQWVQDIIANTVESMMIADVNGQQLVELVLDKQGEVPAPFLGANMTLVQTGNEIAVKFSNFVDNMQMVQALELVANNPVQLAGLVEALKNRSLNLAELTVGGSIVQLPTIEEVQTPLHMIAANIHQRDEEKDQQQKDQQQSKEQEQNQYKVEEARL